MKFGGMRYPAAGRGRDAQTAGDPRVDRRRGGGTGHVVPDDARGAAADPRADRAAGGRATTHRAGHRADCAGGRADRPPVAQALAGRGDRGPAKITEAYREQLLAAVRQRPRSLGQPYSLWTLQRLADYLVEVTGLRLSYETVRVALKAGGIVLSRPQHTVTSPDPEYQVKKRRSSRPVTASRRATPSTMPTSST